MPINLARSTMRSRIVRELIGERTIDIFSSITRLEQPARPNAQGIIPRFFQNVFNIGRRLAGFLISAAQSFLGWALNNLWDVFVDLAFEIVEFDWNQTDEAIRQQMRQGDVQIAAALGGLAGSGLVWLGSVAVSSALSFKFPVLGGAIALELAKEGGEEIRASLFNFLRTSARVVARNVLYNTLLTARRMRLFGLVPITQQKEPWTIAGAVERRIERIPDARLRAFVEGFLEEATESLIEVGYVISYVLDDYYSASKLAAQRNEGPTRAIRLTPDRRVENETIVLRASQQHLIRQVPQILATHQLIYNRDVGEIVGQPAEDWVRAKVQRRKLTLVFKSKPEPPWRAGPNQSRTKEVTVTIPEVKRGLTWREIKAAARKWTWGKFRATAQLTTGRQMVVYGATANEAENKLREFLTLTTLELSTLSVTEEKDRNRNLRKLPTVMYPAYGTMLIRRPALEPQGRTDIDGDTYSSELRRFELWPANEPPGLGVLS